MVVSLLTLMSNFIVSFVVPITFSIEEERSVDSEISSRFTFSDHVVKSHDNPVL